MEHFTRVDGNLLTEERTTYFYHTDLLGSTVLVTNELGQTVWNSEYTPFGQVAKDDPGFNKAIKFTGKDLDQDIGFYYFNARWYDSDIGRFISEDPIKDGLNWYTYAISNPLVYVDPSGLKYIPLRERAEEDGYTVEWDHNRSIAYVSNQYSVHEFFEGDLSGSFIHPLDEKMYVKSEVYDRGPGAFKPENLLEPGLREKYIELWRNTRPYRSENHELVKLHSTVQGVHPVPGDKIVYGQNVGVIGLQSFGISSEKAGRKEFAIFEAKFSNSRSGFYLEVDYLEDNQVIITATISGSQNLYKNDDPYMSLSIEKEIFAKGWWNQKAPPERSYMLSRNYDLRERRYQVAINRPIELLVSVTPPTVAISPITLWRASHHVEDRIYLFPVMK